MDFLEGELWDFLLYTVSGCFLQHYFLTDPHLIFLTALKTLEAVRMNASLQDPGLKLKV